MWFWVFVVIAVFGLIWHGLLFASLIVRAKKIAMAANPLVTKVAETSAFFGQKPELAKPVRAVDINMDVVLVERLKMMRQRRAAKAERQRRLINNLKKIDPTESRFTRVRKRS